MKTFKYLDKELLVKINDISEKVFHFNRTIPARVIDALPADKFFIVTFVMLHEHIAGKAVDPHVRCVIYTGPDSPHGQLILDMETALYDMLPTFEQADEAEPVNDSNTPATVS
jgi:hypothetical protein